MLMLWLVLMGTLELADLETQMTGMRWGGSLYICGCGVKAPSVGKKSQNGEGTYPRDPNWCCHAGMEPTGELNPDNSPLFSK